MASLNDIRDAYIEDGINYANASARAAQDAILDLISKSTLSRNVTIKGGVLMQHISKDARRATTDFDLDFVRYSIEDASIKQFLNALNKGASDFAVELTGPIEELKHQDYSGMRIFIRITDNASNTIDTKMDIGVHKFLQLEQEDICFDLSKLDEGVTLLGNSDEQVVAEKLKSLLRIGAASTRYKDVFDIYYLLVVMGVRAKEMEDAIQVLIYDDTTMRENNTADIHKRLSRVLNDRRFKPQLAKAKNNWLQVSTNKVIAGLLACFE